MVVKIQPNALVLSAIVAPAGNRAMLPHGTLTGRAIVMTTIAIRIVRDQIRLTQVPPNDTFLDILLGQGKMEPAACRLTDRNTAGTIDFHFFAERVLVIFIILYGHH